MKKNLHLFYLFFLGFLGYGQSTAALDLQENTIQNYFTNIEKNRIPNGLLLDAAVEFADLKKFDGTLPDSSYTSSKLVINIYNTLITSRLHESGIIPKQADTFISEWKTAQKPDIIPLGGLFYQYAKYSDYTNQNIQNENGTITINGRTFFDKYVNGQWVNPYDEKKVFALAPAINGFNKHNFKIILPDNLFLSNKSSEIQKIEYKLDDAQPYQILPSNQLIDVSYPTEGVYHWTFKMTLNSGEILYSHTQFSVNDNLGQYVDYRDSASKTTNLAQYTKVLIDPVTIPNFPGYPNIQIAPATMYIKLAPGHTRITKPLIVAEGFDMGIVLSPSEEGGFNTITSFLNSLQGNLSLRSVINSDYDVVYVDNRNGVDYIQNNAALMKKAIQWVNNNKVGTEKNVVIGQSMGGLVARYALKDMEDLGQNHDSKLFISHDSPHLGANIPLGLQSLLINLSNTYIKAPLLVGIGEFIVPTFTQGVSVNDVLTLADVPAARQMLMNYYNKSYNIDNSMHNTWQNELKAKGYPQQTRNVAISNGSECGTDQTLTDIFRYYNETTKSSVVNDIIASLVGVFTNKIDMIILSTVPGSSKFVFDFSVRPMANLNENKQIYDGHITYKKKIFGLFNAQTSLLNGSKDQPSGVLPIDKYGGGKFSFDDSHTPNGINITPFGFIPTTSALNVFSGNQTLTENDYQKPYSPQNDNITTVPFANFVAERVGLNAPHITFSQRNGDFIINQLSTNPSIQAIKLESAYLCGTKVEIKGEKLLCSDEVATYTTGFAPNILWSIVSGADLVNIQGPTITPQITLKAKTNASGYVKLQALLYGSDGSNTITKDIWVGRPQFYIYKNTNNLPDITYEIKSPNPMSIIDQGVATSTQAVWKRLDNGGTRTGFSYMVHPVNYSFDMEVTITNECGSSVSYVSVPAAGPAFKLITDNNNANKYSVYKMQDNSSKIQTNSLNNNENYEIKIVNSLGMTVISKTGNSFDLSNLPTGTYFVNIIKDNVSIIGQTLIKK